MGSDFISKNSFRQEYKQSLELLMKKKEEISRRREGGGVRGHVPLPPPPPPKNLKVETNLICAV